MADHPTLDLPPAPLTGERRIPLTDHKLRTVITAMLGMRAAKSVLEEEGKFAHDLVGMKVARTLIDKHLSEFECDVHRRLTRVMAAAGVDLAAWQAWSFMDGGEAVICRPIQDKLADTPNGG